MSRRLSYLLLACSALIWVMVTHWGLNCSALANELRCLSVASCESAFDVAETPQRRWRLAERVKCLRMIDVLGAAPEVCTARATPASDEVWVAFFARKKRLHRFVIHHGSVRELPSRSRVALRGLLVAARDQLEFDKVTQPRRLWLSLHRCYQRLLVDAISERGQMDRLVLLPDGLSRFIPLHALVVATQPLRFLVEDWVISYLPAGPLARHATEPNSATSLLPEYGHPGRPLAGALVEATALRAVSSRRGWPSRRRWGSDVTTDAVLSAFGRSGQLVHVGAHGIADLRLGAPPELLLTDSERGLTVKDVVGRPLAASLVVLGSCTAGYVARFRNGPALTAPTNLAEALLVSGVGSVVAASWGVKDQQSAAQLRRFFSNLADGPAAALAAAQRERIGRLRPPHPRYWAFYAVYGAARWR